MQRDIKDDCINACMDDDYRDLEVKTTYSNQTFKLILIPIWLGTITYKGKNYYFSLNGQTGKIHGDKPKIEVPAWKVLLFLAIIGAIIALILKFLHFVYLEV
jgi:hypothetical protein